MRLAASLLALVAAASALVPRVVRRPLQTTRHAAVGVTEKKDRMGAAAAATSFAGRSALILPFVVSTGALAASGASLPVAAAPVLLLVHKFLKSDGESAAERALKVASLATVWVAWSSAAAYAALRPFGARLTAYHALAVYAPLVVIAFKTDRDVPYRAATVALLRVLFDAPLVVCARLLRAVGVRLFTPFASVVDDDVVQGTLPFAADVPVLAAPPYDVCAVVNLCAEWPGPTAAYAAAGITQLRLPHQDTTAPTEASLRAGAAFIRDQLAAHPGKRVYVHCKGGIARATSMSLAHYILNRNETAANAVDKLKKRRHVVMRNAAKYAAVRALERAPGSD